MILGILNALESKQDQEVSHEKIEETRKLISISMKMVALNPLEISIPSLSEVPSCRICVYLVDKSDSKQRTQSCWFT